MRPIDKVLEVMEICRHGNPSHGITALLRIRREEFAARPLDNLFRLVLFFVFPVLIWIKWPFALVEYWPKILATLAWCVFFGFLCWKYPSRDRLDVEERKRTDERAREVIEELADLAQVQGMRLDKEDRRTLLEIYQGHQIPNGVRLLLTGSADPDF